MVIKMGKTVLKVLLIAIILMIAPVICMAAISLFGILGPMIGLLIILFFPLILIGLIVGYRSGQKKKEATPQIEEK